jgi:hypothetical protein
MDITGTGNVEDGVGFVVVDFDVMGLDVDVVGFSVLLGLGVVDLDFADLEATGFTVVVGGGLVVLVFNALDLVCC